MYILATILAFVLTVCWGSYIEEPLAKTEYGFVKGKLQYSSGGREFYAYKGIPYAKPPINELRFKPPEKPNKWDKVFVAQKDAPHCLQKNYLFRNPKIEGSEDCLYLNVYTPRVKEKRGDIIVEDSILLPVMVFIHWGGFFAGYSSADYLGPEYLMDKDVVLVTFNYRLGVLGFFSTNDDAAPGNYGLKDQLAALKWVNKNIHNFGGNNKSVTLFGQSAGAASVNFHMYNKESRKLFHRAISQSGSSLALWAKPLSFAQTTIATDQGTLMNCQFPQNSTALVECLRKVNAYNLVDSGDKFKIFHVDPLNVFMPSIEKETDLNPKPFLTKDPVEYIREKDFGAIPWIMGVVSDEGLIRAEPLIRQSSVRKLLNTNFEKLMPALLALFMSTSTENIGSLWDKIRDFYFTAGSIMDVQNPKSLQGLIQVYTDRSFIYSSYQAMMFHHLKGHKDIWFYNFDYKGEYSYGDVFAATDENISNFIWGVSHCDELLYLFKTPALFQNALHNHNDRLMKGTMVDLWTNFAIYGNPTPKGKQKASGEWLKIGDASLSTDPKKIHYLSFKGNYKDDFTKIMKMKYGFYKSRIQFWENLALRENIPELNETCSVIPNN